jgi:hypothetical protein
MKALAVPPLKPLCLSFLRALLRGLGACIAPFENSVPKTPSDSLYTLTRSASLFWPMSLLQAERLGFSDSSGRRSRLFALCLRWLKPYSSRRSAFSDIHYPFVPFPEDVSFGDICFMRRPASGKPLLSLPSIFRLSLRKRRTWLSDSKNGSCSFNRTFAALENARRIASCMRDVGTGVPLHAQVTASFEGSSGCLACSPLRYVLQRDCHGRERRFYARQWLTIRLQTAASNVGSSTVCELPCISCRSAFSVLLQYWGRSHP